MYRCFAMAAIQLQGNVDGKLTAVEKHAPSHGALGGGEKLVPFYPVGTLQQ